MVKKRVLISNALGLVLIASSAVSFAEKIPEVIGEYRGVYPAVKFDVSPPLRDIEPKPIPRAGQRGGLLVDPDGDDKQVFGPQDHDPIVQDQIFPQRIPATSVSFDGPPNISGVSPPDPVGDIGPNHYVVMSNLFFQVFDRSGVALMPAAANNTLWDGFGGACENENSGDPIILYDQFADRWLLTQFTSAGPEFFNCVALSTSPDPLGTYYRWAFSNGTNFPDYPKYGMGDEAYFISTRDFQGGSYVGVGAYALNRAEMIAGNPNPMVISFFVDRGATPFNVGDGLLPADVDGFVMPPGGSPHYFVGSMDDGGPYNAPQDALTLWHFDVDFANPGNSSFVLSDTVNIQPYDTIFPCQGGGRNCIPQPGTNNRVDIQSYRQRPLHRLAYRNFGTHESLVTNQSVEAGTAIGGVRWWEMRSPLSNPFIHQEGTFAPGVSDGIHRWMGSAAMDSAGNIGLAYSASDDTNTFPSLFYTGRLVSDPLGTLPQGEGVIVNGTGSQTGSQRWGDYSSINVDPLDDCTFWFTSEYVPTSSNNGWQLRIGAFRFNECGTPGFTLSSTDIPSQSVCAADDAVWNLALGSIASFDSPVTLNVSGNPAPTTVDFSPNPVPALPGTSVLTIGNTDTVAAGVYPLMVSGTAAGADDRSLNLEMRLFDAVPGAPVLMTPADGAMDVDFSPVFSWTGNNAESYTIEVATDVNFTNIVFSATLDVTTTVPDSALDSSTQYFWRVRADNICGPGLDSPVFSFRTSVAPGDCAINDTVTIVEQFDFEDGDQGWTHTAMQGTDTWTLSTNNPRSGAQHWHVDDLPTTSDQLLTSPIIAIPTGLPDLTFQFWNDQQLEDRAAGGCWDGGVLEVSTDGGSSFSQIDNANLLTDPYDGALNAGPLNGQDAWCGDPQAYLNSVVDIESLAGQSVIFRFRISTDGSVGRQGWDIDDVVIQGCSNEEVLRDGFENPL